MVKYMKKPLITIAKNAPIETATKDINLLIFCLQEKYFFILYIMRECFDFLVCIRMICPPLQYSAHTPPRQPQDTRQGRPYMPASEYSPRPGYP